MNGLPRHDGGGSYLSTLAGENVFGRSRRAKRCVPDADPIEKTVYLCPGCMDEFDDEDEAREHIENCEEV